MIIFAYPKLFWLLILPFLAYYMLPIAGKMYGDALHVPFVTDILRINKEGKYRRKFYQKSKVQNFIRLLLLSITWALFTVALCRPQWAGEPHKIERESRDIMLVVDISTSMLEQDFAYKGRLYNRLAAVKSVVSDFADARTEDRIGLILFGTRAYQQVPLTYDRQSLKEVLYAVDAGMAGNSTSIGDAVGLALKNLSNDNKAENKVIILLTDGQNNDGSISFPQVIKLAEEENVKIYTIGMANDHIVLGGLFSVPVDSGLDEASLKQLAAATKGNYFRVKNVKSLYDVYNAINRLEVQKNEGNYVQDKKDLFYYPLALAMLCFMGLFLLWRKK